MKKKRYMRTVFGLPRDNSELAHVNTGAPTSFKQEPSRKPYEFNLTREDYLFGRLQIGGQLVKVKVADNFAQARESILAYKGDKNDIVEGAFASLYYGRMFGRTDESVKATITNKDMIEFNKKEMQLKDGFKNEYGAGALSDMRRVVDKIFGADKNISPPNFVRLDKAHVA